MDATPSSAQLLLLDRITHQYAGHKAVDGVMLDIGGGELVALLGPSGCGKATLLRIVAGLVQQTAGQVVVGGQAVDALPPSRRPVGIVFQSYALFPHMTVADNVAYGLAARRVDRTARKREAARMLDLVQLGHLRDRLPRALSGGQQQRVALAQALAVQPAILLLGVGGALGIARSPRLQARVLDGLFMAPLVLPALAFGLAALMLFSATGLPVSPLTLTLGHAVVCVPFVVRNTVASLQQLDPALLEGSASLGASHL